MNKPASFGRRGVAAPRKTPAPETTELSLTPEQRTYLFGATAAPPRDEPEGAIEPLHARHAGLIASLAATALITGLSFIGKPQDAATPPLGLDAQAGALLGLAEGWLGPLGLAWSIFATASNVAFNLWLTRKVCAWRNATTLPAFALAGAVASAAIAFFTAMLGLGDSEIGYAMEALAGGAAAALYRLLARSLAVR